MFYVYVLYSKKDHKFYVDGTETLKEEIDKHRAGKKPVTQKRLPLFLCYYEVYFNKKDAQARVKFLKTGHGERTLRNQLMGYLEIHDGFGKEKDFSSTIPPWWEEQGVAV